MKRKKNKTQRILHGMVDVAGQGGYSVRGLRENGVDAKLVVWEQNPFGYPVDVNLHVTRDRLRNPVYALGCAFRIGIFALKAAFTYDVFHFHFGYSLLPFGMDLFWLRLMNKRIIMEYHGDDIRYFYNREKPEYYPYDKLVERSRRSIKTNNKVLRYADTFITHDEELRKHIPKRPLFITPLRLDVERFTPSYPDASNSTIRIVHAPSDYVFKGSKYVIKSVEELKKKYDIEFTLVEGKTQQEAFKIYEKADIVIDQLFAQTYGVFAVEAMAMGKPVVGWISEKIAKSFPAELPIVSATIDTLTERLEELIRDGKRRHDLGVAGRKYAETYHDYRKVAQVQAEIYEKKIRPMSTKKSFAYTGNKTIKK